MSQQAPTDGRYKCPRCKHWLFKPKAAPQLKSPLEIEIKCPSCRKIVDVVLTAEVPDALAGTQLHVSAGKITEATQCAS